MLLPHKQKVKSLMPRGDPQNFLLMVSTTKTTNKVHGIKMEIGEKILAPPPTLTFK